MRVWQGRRDLNTQPTVLETVALPLSHSPKFKTLTIITYYVFLVKRIAVLIKILR